jgi:peptidoglycan-associated lipoprotein
MSFARSSALLSFAFLFTTSVLLSSCGPKRNVRKTSVTDDSSAGLTDGIDESDLRDIRGVDVEEPDIRDKSFAMVADLRTVRFDYDTYRLSRKTRLTLRENATYLKAKSKLHVLVEGHADDRGTTEYNVALAQKRARAVREYYMRLGLDGRRIGTLSYGEEKGLCYEPSEPCWRKNRRAATKIETGRLKVDESVSVDLEDETVQSSDAPEDTPARRGWRR